MPSDAKDADGGMRFEGDAATRRHSRNGVSRLDEVDRLVMISRKFGDGAEGAEAPLRIGIEYFPQQEIDGRGAHRSHRNGSASDMKGYSPRAMPKENTVSSGQDKPVRQDAEPAVAIRTSRRPSPCRSGRAADRPRSGPV